MNAKQAAPLAVTLAPLIAAAPGLLIIGGLAAVAVWLLSDDKKKPEASSVPATPERPALPVPSVSAENPVQKSAIPINSGRNIIEKRDVPANSAVKSTVTLAPSATAAPLPVIPIPVTPKIPVPQPSIIPAAKNQPEIPLPAQKKFISREDMAKIFSGGRGLTRKAAVAALKALGYGKTAAYQALEINGRFAPWLQFASDGIITWKMDEK